MDEILERKRLGPSKLLDINIQMLLSMISA